MCCTASLLKNPAYSVSKQVTRKVRVKFLLVARRQMDVRVFTFLCFKKYVGTKYNQIQVQISSIRCISEPKRENLVNSTFFILYTITVLSNTLNIRK